MNNRSELDPANNGEFNLPNLSRGEQHPLRRLHTEPDLTHRFFVTPANEPQPHPVTKETPGRKYYSLGENPHIVHPTLVYYEDGVFYPVLLITSAINGTESWSATIFDPDAEGNSRRVELNRQEADAFRSINHNYNPNL
jgi:hypothetical protein